MAKKSKKKQKVDDSECEFSDAKLIEMMMRYEPPREWYREEWKPIKENLEGLKDKQYE